MSFTGKMNQDDQYGDEDRRHQEIEDELANRFGELGLRRLVRTYVSQDLVIELAFAGDSENDPTFGIQLICEKFEDPDGLWADVVVDFTNNDHTDLGGSWQGWPPGTLERRPLYRVREVQTPSKTPEELARVDALLSRPSPDGSGVLAGVYGTFRNAFVFGHIDPDGAVVPEVIAQAGLSTQGGYRYLMRIMDGNGWAYARDPITGGWKFDTGPFPNIQDGEKFVGLRFERKTCKFYNPAKNMNVRFPQTPLLRMAAMIKIFQRDRPNSRINERHLMALAPPAAPQPSPSARRRPPDDETPSSGQRHSKATRKNPN